jgi:hypothetical protein
MAVTIHVGNALDMLARQHWTVTEADTRLWDKWGNITEDDLDKCCLCFPYTQTEEKNEQKATD